MQQHVCFVVTGLLLQFITHNRCLSSPPNILFVLTDDQDVFLGGETPMKKSKMLIADKGAKFTNMFVTSPICCPSRSSILTGRYVHNGGAVNNSISGNCNGLPWQHGPEQHTFVTHLKQQGYQTFFAGKYLNQYGKPSTGGVKHVPPGWDHWNALVGNSRYYNYTLSVNGVKEKHGDTYKEDYLTDVISRKALKFLNSRGITEQPFFMMLSTPACHANFTPAPQYETEFSSRQAPRTGSFNVHGKNKHWQVSSAQHPMTQLSTSFSDNAFRNRWRTLLSVDDMVEQVIKKLEKMEVLNNTYIVFSSDNGFHLGQFSLPVDKRGLYEFDIRVPLWVRGPGIKPSVRQEVVLNIDLAPTFIEMAGLIPPTDIDGQSILGLLSVDNVDQIAETEWRDSFLVEYWGEHHPAVPNCPQYNGQGVADCFPSCVCEDSWNNTYSCVRTLNKSSDLIFCQFQDNQSFEEFYNIRKDPDQLENIIYTASKQTLVHLRQNLMYYKQYDGGRDHKRLR